MTDTTAATAPVDAPAPKRSRPEAAATHLAGALHTMSAIKAPTPLPRSHGLIKSLYSDFIVREIAFTTREPVVLHSLVVPPEIATKSESAAAQASGEGASAEDIRQAFARLGLPEADVAAVVALFNSAEVPSVTLQPIADKATRTEVHKLVKTQMGALFESCTDSNSCLVVQRKQATRPGSRGGRVTVGSEQKQQGWRNNTWPEGRPENLHFTLYKENLDTASALRSLATKLNLNQRRLSFSGTKDKRGVTTQRISCRHLAAERVAALNGQSFGRNALALVGDFKYETFGLGLGRLHGNEFTIVVRDVDPSMAADSVLNSYESVLNAHGFLNYFGPQRFGTTSIPTSDVGQCILARDYRSAVHLIFKSKAEIVVAFAPVLAAFENEADGNARFANALSLCPHYCYEEKDMLTCLSASPNNFEGAVMRLPRNGAMLYCHAVQSLVWNHIVSQRIETHPHVAVGDLVYAAATTTGGTSVGAVGTAAVTEAGEDTAATAGNDDDAAENDEPQYVAGRDAVLSRVTQEDIDADRYSLADVLIPVPGPDSELLYPQHPSCDYNAYRAVAQKLGVLSLLEDEHNLAKVFHFHGTYRQLSVKPGNLKLRAVQYQDPRQLLIETDGMKLKGVTIDHDSRAPPTDAAAGEVSAEPQPVRNSVICTFSLRAGSYATSLLREMFDFVDHVRS